MGRQWWERVRPRTLRSRLIVWNSLLVGVLFTLLGVVVYFVQANTLETNAQASLARETSIVQTALTRDLLPQSPYWPATLSIPEIDDYTAPGVTVQIMDLHSTIRYSSAGTGVQPIQIPPALRDAVLHGQSVTREIKVEHQRTLMQALPVTAQGQVIGIAVITRTLSDIDDSLATLRNLLIATTIIALVLAMFAGWQITRRALRPLAQIAGTANAITRALSDGAGNTPKPLHLRVPPVDDAGEPGALVADVNRMLDALDAYDLRQRQFIMDASHELRAPLTTIRGNLEFVRRTDNLTTTEYDQAMHDASAEAEQMAVLITDLLALARAESGTPATASLRPVELDAVLIEAFQVARERARALGLSPDEIQLADIAPMVVQGDAAQLRQVVLILIDNALKYAPGPLWLSLCAEAGVAVLTVRDAGPGISSSDLPHLFERFYRADRARDREGSGLGLAIAHTIITSHGGSISATSPAGKGATFTVRLPLMGG
jgi:two-component system OmpR family sensor kinase